MTGVCVSVGGDCDDWCVCQWVETVIIDVCVSVGGDCDD